MISSAPKFRSDLDLHQQTTANGTALVVRDPLSGELFRLRETERFIAQQLDGETPLDVVQRRVEKAFGARLAPEALADFIKTLDRQGLLEAANGTRKGQPVHGGRNAATTSGQPEPPVDSVWENLFRLRAAKYFLARQLDSQMRIDVVRQCADQDLSKSPTAEAPARLTKSPEGKDPMQSEKTGEPRKPNQRRRRRGTTSATSSQPESRPQREIGEQQTTAETTNAVKAHANGDGVHPGTVEDFTARQLDGANPAQAAGQSAEQDFATLSAAEAPTGVVPGAKINDLPEGEKASELPEPGQRPSERQEISATSSCPKLRVDLELREQRTGERTTFVVKDPISGDFFRLQEAERFIAQQLDGVTSLEMVRSRVEEKFGGTLAPEALAGFIRTLNRNGLLETDKSDRKKRRGRRRINGSLLYLRFRLFDPDRLFTALAPRIRWCFTPAFVLLSSSLILAAVALAVFNWADVVQDFSRLYAFSTLPLLLVTIFCVLTLHEFGHGLTCKHFGGEVRELGFLLLYFQPAMYCNVSDAWLFPEKSKRLWVGFAGPYFELVLWALAMLTWRVADTATFLNTVALVVIATSGIKTFFNFNPLIKLDGYYLLSDYLDIANLRKKSFAYVGGFLKRIFGFADEFPPASPRERRIFLAYGLTASVFSFSFLGFAALTVGNFLLEQHERAAFLGLTALIATRLRRKFRKMFRGASNLSDDEDFDSTRPPDPGESGQHEPAEPRKMRTPEPRKRMRRAWKRRIKLAVLACLTLAFLFLGRMELRVAGPINVLPIHNADVRTEIAGIIEEIFVDEGDRVRKGDRIARLSDRDQRAELEKTQAEVQQVQARFDLLTAGPTPEQIDVARMAVTKAEDRLKFAQAKLARDQALFEQQLLSRNDFDITRELESTATNELASAKSSLQVLLKGSRPEEIKAAQAELERLQAQRRFLEEQLGLLNVVSPASGIVTTPSRQLKEMIRQMVQKGDMIAKVHELKTVTLEAAVSEKEIADVRAGQAVALKVRAYPDRIFHGKVTEIATTAQGAAASSAASSTKPGASASSAASAGRPANTVLVTTEIDNSADLLKPGMTGMAKIYCGERRFIDLVMRRLSLTFRVEFWSWW